MARITKGWSFVTLVWLHVNTKFLFFWRRQVEAPTGSNIFDKGAIQVGMRSKFYNKAVILNWNIMNKIKPWPTSKH